MSEAPTALQIPPYSLGPISVHYGPLPAEQTEQEWRRRVVVALKQGAIYSKNAFLLVLALFIAVDIISSIVSGKAILRIASIAPALGNQYTEALVMQHLRDALTNIRSSGEQREEISGSHLDIAFDENTGIGIPGTNMSTRVAADYIRSAIGLPRTTILVFIMCNYECRERGKALKIAIYRGDDRMSEVKLPLVAGVSDETYFLISILRLIEQVNVLQHQNVVDRLKSTGSDLSRIVEAWNTLGTAMLQEKELTSAIAAYEYALRIDPSNSSILVALGDARFSTGELVSAEKTYSEGILHNPRQAAAYLGRARAREARGDNLGALNDRKEAARLDPTRAGRLEKREAISPLGPTPKWKTTKGQNITGVK